MESSIDPLDDFQSFNDQTECDEKVIKIESAEDPGTKVTRKRKKTKPVVSVDVEEIIKSSEQSKYLIPNPTTQTKLI